MLNYFDTTRSDDVVISGWLKKQSPSMFVSVFQERYCVITGNDRVFRYFHKEEDSQEAGNFFLLTSEVELVQQQNNEPDCKIMVIKLAGKERMFVFEADTHEAMMTWVKAIKALLAGKWAKGGRVDLPSSSSDDDKKDDGKSAKKTEEEYVKTGYLNKESRKKFQLAAMWQRRYVEISTEDCILRYYKDEEAVEPLGSPVNIALVDSVLPVKRMDPDCRILVLKSMLLDKDTLTFQASSPGEMMEWVEAIESCMAVSKRKKNVLLRMGEAGEEDEEDEDDNKEEEKEEEELLAVHPASAGEAEPSPEPEVVDVVTVNPATPFLLSGYLEKESANKYVKHMLSMQRRYVTLSEDGALRYYKTEAASCDPANALHSVDVPGALFVRAYDTSEGCTRFEIGESREGGGSKGSPSLTRTFLFSAETSDERARWVRGLTEIMERYQAGSEDMQEIPPPIVSAFETGGRDALLGVVNAQLEAIYPSLWAAGQALEVGEGEGEGEGESHTPSPEKMAAHLDKLRAVISFLEARLSEVRKTKSRAPRYDAMVLVVDAVNRFIDTRLHLVTLKDGPTSAYERCTTAEMYSLITVLTAHQRRLNQLYCPVLSGSEAGRAGGGRQQKPSLEGEEQEEGGSFGTPLVSQGSSGCWVTTNAAGVDVYRFQCDIFHLIPTLCSRYIDGSPSHGVEGTAAVLVEHCQRVWNTLLKNPADMIHSHEQDGSLYTEMPTAVWRGLHLHARMATEAGSNLLHVMVAEKVAEALSGMIGRTRAYVENIEAMVASDHELRGIEMEYVCALANDNAIHLEELLALVDDFHIEEIREKVNDSAFHPSLFLPAFVAFIRCCLYAP